MIYKTYTIGGELYHADKGLSGVKNKVHKYIDKVRTKSGKWRYIYENTKNYKENKKLYKRHFVDNTSGKQLINKLSKGDKGYSDARNDVFKQFQLEQEYRNRLDNSAQTAIADALNDAYIAVMNAIDKLMKKKK